MGGNYSGVHFFFFSQLPKATVNPERILAKSDYSIVPVVKSEDLRGCPCKVPLRVLNEAVPQEA